MLTAPGCTTKNKTFSGGHWPLLKIKKPSLILLVAAKFPPATKSCIADCFSSGFGKRPQISQVISGGQWLPLILIQNF